MDVGPNIGPSIKIIVTTERRSNTDDHSGKPYSFYVAEQHDAYVS